MGLVPKTTNRVWQSLSDKNFANNSTALAQFAVGEEVYYKQNGSYLKAKITSLNAFVASSAERWYFIKVDTESSYWKVTEKISIR